MEIVRFKDDYWGEYGVRAIIQYGYVYYDLYDPSITYDLGNIKAIRNTRGTIGDCERVVQMIKTSKDEGEIYEYH